MGLSVSINKNLNLQLAEDKTNIAHMIVLSLVIDLREDITFGTKELTPVRESVDGS